MSEHQEGYEFVDKRRKYEEEQQEDAIEETGDPVESPEDENVQQTEGVASVPDLIVYMISLLAASAWQHMGLIVNPSTGKAEVDFKQARLAIDSFEALSEKVAPFIDEETNRQLRRSLSDLRMNYIEKKEPGQGGD